MDSPHLQEHPTVLVVEDNPELASQYRIWLEGFCTVHIASDCESAYGFFNKDVDVVLLDRELPDGSGDDILAWIRAMGLEWSVAIVSGIDPSLPDFEMPFDEYLQKPVERAEITTTVKRLYLRSEIGNRLEEFYALSTKKQLLEQYYPSHELLSKEKYAAIERRLEELYSMLKYSHSVGLNHYCSQSG